MRRDHWQRRIAELDPPCDYEQISRLVSQYEFSWDILQALSFALFRTYAVPSIGALLYETGGFTDDTQRRHDDTVLILEHIGTHGMESADGRRAIRRMNQMHGRYNISDDDMRYVLATFAVTPVRWVHTYGKRPFTKAEIRAGVLYYSRLGALMGITDIPQSYEEFTSVMDSYEAAQFSFNQPSRAVADATLNLLATFYPKPFRPAVRLFSRAILDDHLRIALGYPDPGSAVRWAAHRGLQLRGKLAGLVPPRRRPFQANRLRRVRSYPGGYLIDQLGTFDTDPIAARKESDPTSVHYRYETVSS